MGCQARWITRMSISLVTVHGTEWHTNQAAQPSVTLLQRQWPSVIGPDRCRAIWYPRGGEEKFLLFRWGRKIPLGPLLLQKVTQQFHVLSIGRTEAGGSGERKPCPHPWIRRPWEFGILNSKYIGFLFPHLKLLYLHKYALRFFFKGSWQKWTDIYKLFVFSQAVSTWKIIWTNYAGWCM